MEVFMYLQRKFGTRYLTVAFFVTLTLLCVTFSFYSRSGTPLATAGTSLTAQEPSKTSDLAISPPTPLELGLPLQLQGEQCAITKVSMLYGAHKMSQLIGALETHRRHCERWGCGFESLDEDLTTRKLYSKHYFLMSTMLRELAKPESQRKQWLMWVDADSILVNPAISPCAFLPPDELDSVFALVTADHQGLNNGVFYLRVHPSALDLLTQVADYPLAHPHEDLGWFGEQAAMENVIRAMEKLLKDQGSPPGIAWVPREWFNTYEFEHGFEGKPGHFMVHFAGLAETRISHMGKWLQELENNQAEWEKPLEGTFYAKAIPDFWTAFAANVTHS